MFSVSFEDIATMVTDCGSDVKTVALVARTIHMTCLAHLDILRAKKFVHQTEPEEDEADGNNPSESEFEEECVLRKFNNV